MKSKHLQSLTSDPTVAQLFEWMSQFKWVNESVAVVGTSLRRVIMWNHKQSAIIMYQVGTFDKQYLLPHDN